VVAGWGESKEALEIRRTSLSRFGMAVPFQGDAERAAMFQKMDENGDGSISFDEWLSFSVAEIISKVSCHIFHPSADMTPIK
jgi:hypothetical protein